MNEYEAQERQALIAGTLACLSYGWHIRKIGQVNSSAILVDESRRERLVPSHDWFYLCDNGGEFNVGRINHEPPPSVPYTCHGYNLDCGTIAYRVAMAMRGGEIDYDFRLPEIAEAVREAA